LDSESPQAQLLNAIKRSRAYPPRPWIQKWIINKTAVTYEEHHLSYAENKQLLKRQPQHEHSGFLMHSKRSFTYAGKAFLFRTFTKPQGHQEPLSRRFKLLAFFPNNIKIVRLGIIAKVEGIDIHQAFLTLIIKLGSSLPFMV
jgi:hypothetical protein